MQIFRDRPARPVLPERMESLVRRVIGAYPALMENLKSDLRESLEELATPDDPVYLVRRAN